MLPDSRSLDSETTISFITSSEAKSSWQTFELVDRDRIATALTLLKSAYLESKLLS
jgi:hypothetical protein